MVSAVWVVVAVQMQVLLLVLLRVPQALLGVLVGQVLPEVSGVQVLKQELEWMMPMQLLRAP
jgi:hypothetical protein